MRPGLSALLVLLASQASAQTSLQLRWEVKGPLGGGKETLSRAAFTLTNRDTKPLGSRGWAIYFSALHEARPGTVRGGVTIESVTGDFQRIVPKADFPGLAPGQTVEFEYLTSPLTNVSFAPAGPYIVFDEAPGRGHTLRDYRALPFERPKPPGPDPRQVRLETQYAFDESVRDVPLESLPPVFPTPLSLEKREGHLRLEGLPSLRATPDLKAEADLAAEYLRPYWAKARVVSPSIVRLETGPVPGADSPEAYELVVDPREGVRILGNSAAGVFYGLQSLRSLLPVDAPSTGLALPALRVVDAPRFGYRGLMLDVARNFQPKATVLRAIDLMARYKLNALHLHLTDDEGWRVEIPSLPELTSIGARRGHTLDSSTHLPPAWGSGPDVDRPFGSGFYTKADYAEILRYAAARHIEVIPELEMPGHARAAIKAMEARFLTLTEAGDREGAERFLLSEKDDRSSYTSAQLYHDNVMNVALPSTYAFIDRVVQDLVALHHDAGVPLLHLHMGGDEVPAGVFERSPAAQAYLKEHQLGSVDDLWFVFYARVEQILKAQGLPLSGWEEIGVRKARLDGRPTNIPNPGFADRGWRTYVWNNVPGWGSEDLAYRLANGGYKVVFCPVSNLYFDMAANTNADEPGLHWGGYVDLDKPFGFIPFDYYRNVSEDSNGHPLDRAVFDGKERLTDRGRSNILGLQGNLFSETLTAEGRLEYMLVPKLLAFAERAWAPDPAWALEKDDARSAVLYRDAWSTFAAVVGKRELPRLDRELPGFPYRIPTPGLRVVDGQVRSSLRIPGFVMRYTTDGSEPTATSAEVRGPLPATGVLRVAAFDARGRKGHTATFSAR